ncbi:MAG: hypothetical protein K2I29_01795, partial [Clostridia bacterium]|nr:hypothetical protein [Clostridia bacterium]
KTNVNDLARSFTVTPKEVDFAGVEWLIDGNKVAGNTVSYNGQMYSATLNLGNLADDFEVYYTNGTYKNVGNVRTTATIVAKNSNYKAVGAVESYDWAISGATATVAWNDDGTVASISGDNTAATGGSFFEKSGAGYKVVYKRGNTVLDGAPTEAGDYTAEVVLALGNDGNVNVTASSFSFSIKAPAIEPVGGESGFSWWWILLIVITVISVVVAICALIVASKKKAAVAYDDEDGFYDDVTDEDLY